MHAQGCILWQATPFSRLEDDPPTGHLFVLAEWFEGSDRSSVHNLSLRSATGEAVLQQKSGIHSVDDPHVNQSDPFLKRAGIRWLCTTPVNYLDGERGALNAYRTIDIAFSENEKSRLEGLSRLLPSLYQTITDKVSYGLVERVNHELQAAAESRTHAWKSWKELKRIAGKICGLVADKFQVLEVSIFLETKLDRPGFYYLVATTWPETEMKEFKKREYKALDEEGLTGWVLAHQENVRILNLADFEDDCELIQRQYPGIQWNDSLHIGGAVRRILQIPEEQKLQPLSFLAVPILVAGRLFGVIRCCTAREGPYYFTEREAKLLGIVADQIGRAWSHWLSRREMEEENLSLQRFVDRVRTLNHLVQDQVAQNALDEKKIFEEVLRATSDVLQGAEISDIRLLDKEHQELYYAATYGNAWDKGTPRTVRKRRARRFLIDDPPSSGGAYVVKTGKVYEITDTKDQAYSYSLTFSDTRRGFIAPIRMTGETFGVLDIRSTEGREFPRHASLIAELLGQQLGLYLYLLSTIRELQRLPEQQNQIYEDFTHQLRSPIFQVYQRARACVDAGVNQPSTRLERQLMALRGLASKAKRVSQNLGLFADLARSNPIQPATRLLSVDMLVRMLIEGTIDQKSILDPMRALDFHVETESFDALRPGYLEVDSDLLFQAVNNLLDNAAKYSYPKTTVRVEGSVSYDGQFYLAVINSGIKVTLAESIRAQERGWRSDTAKRVTGEGSGIGLWIVSSIMRAHGGELTIFPTNREGVTEVRLIFPRERLRR
jgi:signal transduction histidine kinase